MSDLLSRVITGAWHVKGAPHVNLLLPFGGFERCRSGRSKHAVVLLVNVARLVLAWAEATINVVVFEALHTRTKQLQTVRSIDGSEHASVGLIGTWSRTRPLSIIVVAHVIDLEIAAD